MQVRHLFRARDYAKAFPKVRGLPVQLGLFPAVRAADLRQRQTLPASQNRLFCEVAKVRKTSVALIRQTVSKPVDSH